jgi:hypothetical protein
VKSFIKFKNWRLVRKERKIERKRKKEEFQGRRGSSLKIKVEGKIET